MSVVRRPSPNKGEMKMKKIIAIAAILVSTQSYAFFDDGNANGTFVNNGKADVTGNATGEGEGSFNMSFTGEGATKGKTNFVGNNNGSINGRADDSRDTGAMNGIADNAASGRGEGDASGKAQFAMSFAGRAKANGDFKGNGNLDNNNAFASQSTPYYYAPVAK